LHAYAHLQLSTYSGPIAGMTAVVGLVVVVTALWFFDGYVRHGLVDGSYHHRRAC
jgi:hypothetical protein